MFNHIDRSAGIWRRLKKSARRLGNRALSPKMQSVLPLSDEAFLKLFDWPERHRPGDRVDQSCGALLDHLQWRLHHSWPAPPKTVADIHIRIDDIYDVDIDRMSPEDLIEAADEVMDDRIGDGGVTPRIKADGRIDWHFNPTSNPEWHWWLNRHHWWPLLASAYRETGREAYAEKFVSQLTDWILNNPPPSSKNENSPNWRLMEAGLRMRVTWIPSFALFFDAPVFVPEAKMLMLRSICDHARFLACFKSRMNHLLREANGLACVAAYFPEFKAAKGWLQTALSRIDAELDHQVNTDGTHVEMSTGYQWLAVDEFEKIWQLLQDCRMSLPNHQLPERLEQMYRVLAYIIRPDGAFPQTNDGFLQWSPDRIAAAGKRFARGDFVFIGSGGRSGDTPSQTSTAFEDAGLFVMRSSWSPRANYLLFDAGPYGGHHGHEDMLSIEVAALGAPFVVDPGSYTYDPKDPFRTYFVGSHGHNTVLVDGRSQIRRWHPHHMAPKSIPGQYAHWMTRAGFDYVSATYDEGYGPFRLTAPAKPDSITDVVHTRSVLFVKPDYWIVLDALTASADHDYQLLFHCHPTIEATIGDDHRVCLRSDRRQRLYLIPLGFTPAESSIVKGCEDPIQGWYSERPYHKEPAPTVIYRQSRCRSTFFATAIYPYADKGKDETVDIQFSPITVDGGGYAFRIAHPFGVDTVMMSSQRAPKRFDSMETNAQIAVIRMDRHGRELSRIEE